MRRDGARAGGGDVVDRARRISRRRAPARHGARTAGWRRSSSSGRTSSAARAARALRRDPPARQEPVVGALERVAAERGASCPSGVRLAVAGGAMQHRARARAADPARGRRRAAGRAHGTPAAGGDREGRRMRLGYQRRRLAWLGAAQHRSARARRSAFRAESVRRDSERLDALLRHAREHSRVLSRAPPARPVALEHVPPLDKATMMERFDDLVTDPRLRRDALLAWSRASARRALPRSLPRDDHERLVRPQGPVRLRPRRLGGDRRASSCATTRSTGCRPRLPRRRLARLRAPRRAHEPPGAADARRRPTSHARRSPSRSRSTRIVER